MTHRARRIALEFEPGVDYDEATVNAIVGRFSTDHAALRRHLVDEGFLDRDHGRYWRTGRTRRRLTEPPERPADASRARGSLR